MLLTCLEVKAYFADQGIGLARPTPGPVLWDEHGGTFILRVDDLEVVEEYAPESESGCRLEIALAPQETLTRDLEEFAAQHQLPLAPPPGPELSETPILAACHLPGKNLFIFAEEPTLAAQKRGAAVTLTVTGLFKARKVPCQATDLVIHFSRAAMARMVAFLLTLARAGD